jgi:hypothetical protein
MDTPHLNTAVCSQCGLIHPPLIPGQICPMIKQKTENNEIINIDDFIVISKNLIIDSIKKKNIKNINKLTKNLTILIAKYLEKYTDEEISNK